MGSIKERNIKNRTYYFYNYIIDSKTFDSKNLKLDEKTYKDLDIYNIGYVTIKKIGDCYDVNSVNPLYLHIDNASGYIEEKESNKCLIFDSTDENKELLKRYNDVLSGLIDKIKKIDDDWLEYKKDYTNIKFNSIDNLPLNKPLKFYQMTITIICVISEEYKLYPQVFLDGALDLAYKNVKV